MSLTSEPTDTDELPVSKLCRETLVAIEGLKNWDTQEEDEYLEFFGYILEDLDSTGDSRRGGFPLIERLNIEEDDEVIKKIEQLDEFATDIKQLDPEERGDQYDEDQVQEMIKMAEQIYSLFDNLETGYGSL